MKRRTLGKGVQLDLSSTEAEIRHNPALRSGCGLRFWSKIALPMSNTITLRKFTPQDLDDFWEWATDHEVTKHLTWDLYTSREEAVYFLNNVAIVHPWMKAVCLDGKAIGSITLSKGQGYCRCTAELGYCFARKYWGQGYATQAVKLVLADGFRDLDIERVQAVVHPENTASMKVLEKAGFVKEGHLRSYMKIKGKTCDAVIFSAVVSASISSQMDPSRLDSINT